jgi:phosphoglycolate phosphatase
VKLFLFDVDQTLISTGGAGIRALNRAFEKVLSVRDAMDGILPHGKTDPGIVREIFESRALNVASGAFPETLSAILDCYLEFLDDEIAISPIYKVLPGITPILDLLSRHPGVLVGLATGNVEPGARIKLERGNLNRYFAFGGFGSDSENRTELVRRGAALGAEKAIARWGCAPEPNMIFVIGDTPRDIDAGREAGFQTIGVATGKYSVPELSAAGATAAIADFETDRDAFLRAVSG